MRAGHVKYPLRHGQPAYLGYRFTITRNVGFSMPFQSEKCWKYLYEGHICLFPVFLDELDTSVILVLIIICEIKAPGKLIVLNNNEFGNLIFFTYIVFL